MLFKNFDEEGNLVETEINQETVEFKHLKVDSMINLLFGLRELLVTPCEDIGEKLTKVSQAIELLEQYEPRPPQINYLDEFLKDILGEDAYLFTSDKKNKESDDAGKDT
jgi:hypothetical protein